MTDGIASFQAGRTGTLGEAELGPGRVTVSVEAGSLVIVSAAGRRFALPFGAIGRVRLSRLRNAGLNPGRRRYYRLAIWRNADGTPMILWPDWKEVEAFHSLMRVLADAIWASGGDRVEKGVSWGAAGRSQAGLFLALALTFYTADHELGWNMSYLALIGALGGLALMCGMFTWFNQDSPRAIDGQGLDWVLKA